MIILIAAILDILIGDPQFLYHPVMAMGAIISFEEKIARRCVRSDMGLRIAGAIVVVINLAIGFGVPYLLLRYIPNRTVVTIISIYICYTSIAARELHREATLVKNALSESLEAGRARVARIVGRDTTYLTREGVICATVETVAENASDGVIAPLFYMMLFGPAGAWGYKFINTMDSMIGYRNERYENFGKCAAILDDIANYIPARLTALLMLVSVTGYKSQSEGYRIMKRDHDKHTSPNSAYPESVVAGILGVSLGGPSVYHGKLVKKPFIGDSLRGIVATDIARACSIMYVSELLMLIGYGVSIFLINRI